MKIIKKQNKIPFKVWGCREWLQGRKINWYRESDCFFLYEIITFFPYRNYSSLKVWHFAHWCQDNLIWQQRTPDKVPVRFYLYLFVGSFLFSLRIICICLHSPKMVLYYIDLILGTTSIILIELCFFQCPSGIPISFRILRSTNWSYNKSFLKSVSLIVSIQTFKEKTQRLTNKHLFFTRSLSK